MYPKMATAIQPSLSMNLMLGYMGKQTDEHDFYV